MSEDNMGGAPNPVTLDEELSKIYRELAAKSTMSISDAEQTVYTINRVLHDQNAELDWDDAWDTLYIEPKSPLI